MAKDSETVLEGFQEGPLKFPPTYKFDVGTDTYDTRLVMPEGAINFSRTLITVWIITLLSERSLLAWRESEDPFFTLRSASKQFFFLPPLLRLSRATSPVGRNGNQLGLTGSSGAREPLHPLLRARGSVALFQGSPVASKWPSTTTGVIWSSPSVTTNRSPPFSPCRYQPL